MGSLRLRPLPWAPVGVEDCCTCPWWSPSFLWSWARAWASSPTTTTTHMHTCCTSWAHTRNPKWSAELQTLLRTRGALRGSRGRRNSWCGGGEGAQAGAARRVRKKVTLCWGGASDLRVWWHPGPHERAWPQQTPTDPHHCCPFKRRRPRPKTPGPCEEPETFPINSSSWPDNTI